MVSFLYRIYNWASFVFLSFTVNFGDIFQINIIKEVYSSLQEIDGITTLLFAWRDECIPSIVKYEIALFRFQWIAYTLALLVVLV